ncbi:MAG: GNAT family N-acetyltransferase [Gaiellaceae bacterium]
MIRVADSRADFERCAAIYNAVEPDRVLSAEEAASGNGTSFLHEAGGFAFVGRSSVTGSAFAMVRVHPESRRRGIGSALLAAVRERARELGREAMWGRVRDGESLAFVSNRGFEEVTQEVNVLRELKSGDGEIAAGISELRDEHLREVYALCVETIPEIHVPLPGEAPPYDEWLERELHQASIGFVALDDGSVVGYARLYETGLPHRLEHGLTAVRRSHRRRGLATALKRAQIRWAAEHGYRELVSDMVEGNAAMRALNERLGYRPLAPVFIVSGSAS